MKVIVITATVQRREKALFRCLSALRAQTRKPDEIHIVPDNYKQLSQQNKILVKSIATRVVIAPSPSPMGPACRWIHIDRNILDGESIVLSVDDDLCPNNRYVERTLLWMSRVNGFVTWNLTRRDSTCIPASGISGGLCAMRAKHVRGISKAPLAKEYFRRGFPVDVLVAAYIRSRGVPLLSISDASIDWRGHYQGLPTARTVSIFSSEFKNHLMRVYKTYGFISGIGLNPQPDPVLTRRLTQKAR